MTKLYINEKPKLFSIREFPAKHKLLISSLKIGFNLFPITEKCVKYANSEKVVSSFSWSNFVSGSDVTHPVVWWIDDASMAASCQRLRF